MGAAGFAPGGFPFGAQSCARWGLLRARLRKVGVPRGWTQPNRFATAPALQRDHGGGKFFGRIAQLVEQLTLNQRVPGSSPGAPTNPIKHLADVPSSTHGPVYRSVYSFCSCFEL